MWMHLSFIASLLLTAAALFVIRFIYSTKALITDTVHKEKLRYSNLPGDHYTRTYSSGVREAAVFNWISRDGKHVGNSTILWFTVAQTLQSPGHLLTI